MTTDRSKRIRDVHRGLLKQGKRTMSTSGLADVFQRVYGVKRSTAEDYVATMGRMGLARVPRMGKIELLEEKP